MTLPPQLPPPSTATHGAPSIAEGQAAVHAALQRIGQALADAHRDIHAAVATLAPGRRAPAPALQGPAPDAPQAQVPLPMGDADVIGQAVEAAAQAQEQAETSAQSLARLAMAAVASGADAGAVYEGS